MCNSWWFSVILFYSIFVNLSTGLGDLSFHLGGYISAILSVFSQSFYLLYIQKTGVENGLSTLDVLHLNSVNCIPLLTIYTVYSNQLVNSFYSIKVTAKGFFVSIDNDC